MNRTQNITAVILITAAILPLHARTLQCDPLKPHKSNLSPLTRRVLRNRKCSLLIRNTKTAAKRFDQRLARAKRKCAWNQVNRVVSTTVYKARPNLHPGVTRMVPPADDAIAAAWCLCRKGRYERALKLLRVPALFGWDKKALATYAYLLGSLRSKAQAIRLLKHGCPKDEHCIKIIQLLESKGETR